MEMKLRLSEMSYDQRIDTDEQNSSKREKILRFGWVTTEFLSEPDHRANGRRQSIVFGCIE
jgi:hypothetical protein